MENVYIHESSYVDDNVLIGSNVRIWHFCHIQPGAIVRNQLTVGEGSLVGMGSVVTHDTHTNCVYAGIPAKKIRMRGEKEL